MDAVKIVGAAGKRRKNDFYPTPPEVTRALMTFLVDNDLLRQGSVIWEPASGDGHMAYVLKDYCRLVLATDIQRGQDFLELDFPTTGATERPDWIITNPPFSLAEEFIRHAKAQGVPFAFLLKCQYWHSAKRKPLFDEIRPAYVLPLTWRPDFTGQGSSLMDMCWCVWHGRPTFTQYIPLTKAVTP